MGAPGHLHFHCGAHLAILDALQDCAPCPACLDGAPRTAPFTPGRFQKTPCGRCGHFTCPEPWD